MRHCTIFLVLICALHSHAFPPDNPVKKGANNQVSMDITDLLDYKKRTFQKVTIPGATDTLTLYGSTVALADLFNADASASDESIISKIRAVDTFRRQQISVVESQPISLQIQEALDNSPSMRRILKDASRWPVDHSIFKYGITPETIGDGILSGKNLLSVIHGAERSGKTVLLKQITKYLRAESSVAWTIAIDLNAISIPEQSEWDPNELFKLVLGENYPMFDTLLHVNPIKLNILLDNIDQIPFTNIPVLLNYIENLVVKKVGVVLTTTHKLNWHPTQAELATFKIPELSFAEAKRYLTSKWTKKYGDVTSQHSRDYAHVFTDLLKRSDIPLTFHTVSLVANLIVGDQDEMSIDWDRKNEAFKTDSQFYSLKSYTDLKTPDVQKLNRIFSRIRLNKLYIYEKLVQSKLIISEHYNAEEYGIMALKRILSWEPERSLSSVELNLALSNLRQSQRAGGLQSQVLPYFEYFDSPFSDASYDNYFATRYLLTNFRESASTVATPMSNVLTTIFGNLKYSKLVNFIDSAVSLSADHEPAIHRMCRVMATSATAIGWYQIMDNLLSTGMDNLASVMVHTLSNNPDGLSDYFGKSLKNQPKIPFGAVDRIGSSKSLLETPCTRQEMMFRNNMVSTINALKILPKDTILSFNTAEEYGTILREYLTSSNQLDSGIYIEIRKAMIEHIGETELPTALSNELLYHVLNNCGTMNLYIANHLVSGGAKPAQINHNGETLVHFAVRDLSMNMLNYVVETLKVPIPRGPQFKPILLTLLDTNAVKQYSPARFWIVTEYLLSHGEIDVPPLDHPALSTTIPKPTRKDTSLAAYTTMLTSNVDKLLVLELNAELKSTPFPFESMSPEVRSMRRNIVLTRNVDGVNLQTEPKTLTEILMDYRGFSKYTTQENLAFQNAILKAIDQDCSGGVPMSEIKQIGLVRSIINNAAFDDEVTFAHKALKYLLFRVNEKQAVGDIIEAELKNRRSYRRRWDCKYLERRILQTKAEYYLNKGKSMDTKQKLSNLMADALHCVNARRRRRSPMNCLMSIDEDVSGWVTEIEENGKKIPAIDSDKFVEIIKEIWNSDRPKYRKLIKIAKTMVEKDGVKVIGNLIDHFDHYTERKGHTMTSSLRGLDDIGPLSPERPRNMGRLLTDHLSESIPSHIDASRLQNIPLMTQPLVANTEFRFSPRDHLSVQPQHIATVGNGLYGYNPRGTDIINYYHHELPHVVEMPSYTVSIHVPEIPVARSPPRPAIGNIVRRFG